MGHRSDDVECIEVDSGAHLDDVRALLAAYGRWVASHPGFEDSLAAQGFPDEVAKLPGDYARPEGRLLLITVNGHAAGCVALRSFGNGAGEVKRLFVAPGYRGHSLGHRLLTELLDHAERMGLRELRLDTLPFMNAAVKRYRQLGFEECPPYTPVHLPGARYFRMELEPVRPAVALVPWCEEYTRDFERLNRAWLEEFFQVEEKDDRVFRDPQGEVIDRGGEIFCLAEGSTIIGTCSVVRHQPGEYELAKMAVDPAHRGRGYGEWLVRTAIQFARDKGAARLFLLSDEKLRDALRLYERSGFVRKAFPGATGYARGDVMMEYPLA